MNQAKRILESYDIGDYSIDRMDSNGNKTYHVQGKDKDYLLRISRDPRYSLEEMRSELVWTKYLRDNGLRAQTPHKTSSGNDIYTRGNTKAILLSWFPGVKVGVNMGSWSRERCDLVLRQSGAEIAKWHNLAQGFKRRDGFVRRDMGYNGLINWWGNYLEMPHLDDMQKHIFEETDKVVREELRAYEKSTSVYGMVHGDFHSNNIISDDEGVILIDYDYTCYGWYMHDLAQFLKWFKGRDTYDHVRAQILSGYLKHRDLSNEDLRMIEVIIAMQRMLDLAWGYAHPEVIDPTSLPRDTHDVCHNLLDFHHERR